MSDKTFDKAVDLALREAGKASTLAYLLYQVMNGDVTDDVHDILQEYGYVDENFEWIYGVPND